MKREKNTGELCEYSVTAKKTQSVLNKLEDELRAIVKETDKSQKISSQESLYAFERKGNVLYYAAHKDPEKNKWVRKYIKKANIDLACSIAQGEYECKIKRNAKVQLQAVQQFKRKMQKANLDQVYSSTNKYIQKLIIPIEPTDEQYIEEWLQQTKGEQNTYPNTTELYTNRGEHVRSKSEKIIADKLESMGVPYRYEMRLELKGKRTNESSRVVYPDFAILDVKKRKVWYLEHMGMLEKESYMSEALTKIDYYTQNGIILGKNLIVTYEKEDGGLNTKNLELLLRNYLELE